MVTMVFTMVAPITSFVTSFLRTEKLGQTAANGEHYADPMAAKRVEHISGLASILSMIPAITFQDSSG